MLVLSRQRDEELVIDLSQASDAEIAEMRTGGRLMTIVVVDIRGDKVRLGLNAPRSVDLHRREVWDEIHKEKKKAPAPAAAGTTPTPPASTGEGASDGR